MERHALARGNDDEFIDEFLDMAVPCQCANQILRRLRAFVHPTHCLICTQVIVYDLIDEDMNGTLAKEELVKACGEVSGGVCRFHASAVGSSADASRRELPTAGRGRD